MLTFADMRIPLLMLLFSPAFCLGAGEATGLLPETSRNPGDVEERRAEAMGKRLDSFETMAGRLYRDVQITQISAGGISFSHADGAARLRFDDLTPEQRRYFGINGDDAAAVYAREMKARDAYERKVEEREKARRELAEKEATERAEARRLAMEKAAREREIAAAAEPAGIIPPYPTIQRVDSGLRISSRSSGYDGYYGGFGYGYPVRYGYRPTFHYRGSHCRPHYGTGIHFTVR
jgi:hypothetical protein